MLPEPLLTIEAAERGVRDATVPRRETHLGLQARALLARGAQIGAGIERACHERVLGRRRGERHVLHRRGERLTRLGTERGREATLGAHFLGLGGGPLLRGARRLDLG